MVRAQKPPYMSVVVVTTGERTKHLRVALEALLKQDYPKNLYEVLVIGCKQSDVSVRSKQIKYLPIGKEVSVGAKRNIAAKESRGQVLCFCDDDSTPTADWLSQISRTFIRNNDASVVGGPNITPPNADARERLSGFIYSSVLGTAGSATRYTLDSRKYPHFEATEGDLQTCNLAIRREAFEAVGGFPEHIYPSDETVLLHKLWRDGHKMLYTPLVIVYHRRRPLILGFLRASFRYGKGRGTVVRRFPDSRRFVHMVPSIALTSLIAGVLLSSFIPALRQPFIYVLAAYYGILLFGAFEQVAFTRDAIYAPLLAMAFLLHHLSYGLGYIVGFFRPTTRSSSAEGTSSTSQLRIPS